MQPETPKLADVRFAAMNLLAMREHSVKELSDKLGRKYENAELIAIVLTDLIAQNLQSDERFAEAFTRMRQRQGKGPILIKMELRERGISAALIAAVVNESDRLWSELAFNIRCKRFGILGSIDQRERAKQARFLQSRGFSMGQIQHAFVANNPDD